MNRFQEMQVNSVPFGWKMARLPAGTTVFIKGQKCTVREDPLVEVDAQDLQETATLLRLRIIKTGRAYSTGGGLGFGLNIVTTSGLDRGGGGNNLNLTLKGSGSTQPEPVGANFTPTSGPGVRVGVEPQPQPQVPELGFNPVLKNKTLWAARNKA